MTGRIVPARLALVAGPAVAAVIVVSVLATPRSSLAPGTDHPERARLAGLVAVERERVERLRGVVADLRHRVVDPAAAAPALPPGLAERLAAVREQAGLVAVRGPGVAVELDDAREAVARLDPSAGANLNDYIIHSQDVRAVANGLWAAGAEAVAVNGERIIPTTALLCVGNTLLVNGTVHSPPYRFEAVGPSAPLLERFDRHELVRRLAADAKRFELGFTVRAVPDVVVPEYRGSTGIHHAQRSRSSR